MIHSATSILLLGGGKQSPDGLDETRKSGNAKIPGHFKKGLQYWLVTNPGEHDNRGAEPVGLVSELGAVWKWSVVSSRQEYPKQAMKPGERNDPRNDEDASGRQKAKQQ